MNAANQIAEYVYEESFDHLAKGDDVALAMLNERDMAIGLVDEILEKMTELNTLLTRFNPPLDSKGKIIGIKYEPLTYELIDSVSYASNNFIQYREKIRSRIDEKFWNKLLDVSRIKTLMNTDDKYKLRSLVASKDAPQFELEAVVGTINDQYNKRFTTFCDGAVKLFSSLSCHFKTNDRIKLREKIIFDGAFSQYGWNSFSNAKDQILDLERIFVILDGKDPAEVNIKESAYYKVGDSKPSGEPIELEYFSAKRFKNGNLHLTFKRDDLVEKFNAMLADFKAGQLGRRSSVRN